MTNKVTPRIYVASLADYNAGRLIGGWIDASLGAEHIHEEIASILRDSKEPFAEEWAIHDYEGFCGLSISEWTDIETVARVVDLLQKHGAVFAGLVENFGGVPSGIDDAVIAIEDNYCGCFRSLTEYAEHFVTDCWGREIDRLPDLVRYNIDYEGIGRDMELGGDVYTIEADGEIHVFFSR